MKTKCIKCNVRTDRICELINNIKYFYNKKKQLWNGLRCPKCRKDPVQKQIKRKRRIKSEEHISNENKPLFHSKKTCPKCDGMLELSRYFACMKCVPQYPSDAWDDFIFQNSNVIASELPILTGH